MRDQPLPPATLLQNGKYQIVRVLSQGSLSFLYEGVSTRIRQSVVIKELFPRRSERLASGGVQPTSQYEEHEWEQARQAYVEEASLVAQFSTEPRIMNVLDQFDENNTAYMVTQPAGRQNLYEYLGSRGGKLPEVEAKRLTEEMGHALNVMHAHEPAVYHRDLRPTNTVINDAGGPVLIDFGATRWYMTELAGGLSMVEYRRGFAAPELLDNPAIPPIPQQDIYSLGATLYVMLMGRDRVPVPSAKLTANFGRAVRKAVDKALQVDPARRQRDVGEFIRDLRGDENFFTSLPNWVKAVGSLIFSGIVLGLLTNYLYSWLNAPIPMPTPPTPVVVVSPQSSTALAPTAVVAGVAPARPANPTSLPLADRCTVTALNASPVADSGAVFQEQAGGRTLLNGSGATFPAIYYQLVFPEFDTSYNARAGLYYRCDGSGAGVSAILNNQVDFAAADYQDDSISKAKDAAYLQIPIVLGGVAVLTRLPGSSAGNHLYLSPATISKIYRGEISRWNDPAIAADNANNPTKPTLPDQQIVPVYRKESSGTSRAFASYLYRGTGDPAWQNKDVFPSAVGGRAVEGNNGMIGELTSSEYTIGYVEIAYLDVALRGSFPPGLSYAYPQNSSGKYVEPTWESVREAASDATLSPSLNLGFSDAQGGYPITTASYLIVRRDYQDTPDERRRAVALSNLLRWLLSEGQRYVENREVRSYAALPNPVRDVALRQVCTITIGGLADTCK